MSIFPKKVEYPFNFDSKECLLSILNSDVLRTFYSLATFNLSIVILAKTSICVFKVEKP